LKKYKTAEIPDVWNVTHEEFGKYADMMRWFFSPANNNAADRVIKIYSIKLIDVDADRENLARYHDQVMREMANL